MWSDDNDILKNFQTLQLLLIILFLKLTGFGYIYIHYVREGKKKIHSLRKQLKCVSDNFWWIFLPKRNIILKKKLAE